MPLKQRVLTSIWEMEAACNNFNCLCSKWVSLFIFTMSISERRGKKIDMSGGCMRKTYVATCNSLNGWNFAFQLIIVIIIEREIVSCASNCYERGAEIE